MLSKGQGRVCASPGSLLCPQDVGWELPGRSWAWWREKQQCQLFWGEPPTPLKPHVPRGSMPGNSKCFSSHPSWEREQEIALDFTESIGAMKEGKTAQAEGTSGSGCRSCSLDMVKAATVRTVSLTKLCLHKDTQQICLLHPLVKEVLAKIKRHRFSRGSTGASLGGQEPLITRERMSTL